MPQTAIPIIEKLDPMNLYILYKLFRESARTYKGELVKVLIFSFYDAIFYQ